MPSCIALQTISHIDKDTTKTNYHKSTAPPTLPPTAPPLAPPPHFNSLCPSNIPVVLTPEGTHDRKQWNESFIAQPSDHNRWQRDTASLTETKALFTSHTNSSFFPFFFFFQIWSIELAVHTVWKLDFLWFHISHYKKKMILSQISQIIRFLTCLNKAKVTLMAPKRSTEQSSMRKREGKKNHTKIKIEWDVCLSFCFIFIIAFLPPNKKGNGMPVIIILPLYNPLVLLNHKYIH